MNGPDDVWSSFTYDPRDPRYAALRASDQDRSVVHQVLGEAYADGRLDREEFDERSARVDQIRALGDLRLVLDDLVAPPPSTERSLAHASRSDLEVLAVQAWRAKRRDAAFSFLGTSLITTAIWFATCFGGDGFDPYFFWPVFVIVFSLLHLVRVVRRPDRRSSSPRSAGWRSGESKEQRGRGPFG